MAQGHGSLRDTAGAYYEGQWAGDERNGFGFSSQHRYVRVGEWQRDVYKDYAAARSRGYPVGSYHFFSPATGGAVQAAAFLAHTRFQKGDLPPVLDLEPLPSQVARMGGAAEMWERARDWLRVVERRTGMRPMLYIGQQFVNRYLDAAPDIKRDYPVWIARYGEYKPDVRLWVWQLAPDGRVAGIHGAVDINVFNGYGNEFRRWLERVGRR